MTRSLRYRSEPGIYEGHKGHRLYLRDIEQMIVYSVDAMFLPPPIKAALHNTMIAEINRVNRKIGE